MTEGRCWTPQDGRWTAAGRRWTPQDAAGRKIANKLTYANKLTMNKIYQD